MNNLQEHEVKNNNGNLISNHSNKIIPLVFVILLALIFTVYLYLQSTKYVSTDDAYINAHITRISPQVAGLVTRIYVSENQKVEPGDLLFEIEPYDYQFAYEAAVAKLNAAIENYKKATTNIQYTSITSTSNQSSAYSNVGRTKANLDMALNQIGQSVSSLDVANQLVNSSSANYQLAKTDLERYKKLYKTGAVSKRDYDKAIATYKSAQADLISAKDKVINSQLAIKIAKSNTISAQKLMSQAKAEYQGASTVPQQISMSNSEKKIAKAEIEHLKANVKQALLNMSHTSVYSQQEGYVTAKSTEAGSYINVGQAILSIISSDVWVVANFKETQLEKIQVGMPVRIKIDKYPHKVFKGHVQSIQFSTGAKTSLFPPENAVGSFVKVVQRVPVKIYFDEETYPKYILAPGMSVVPEVIVK